MMGTRRMVVTRRNVWHPIDPDDKKGDENAGDDMRRACDDKDGDDEEGLESMRGA